MQGAGEGKAIHLKMRTGSEKGRQARSSEAD
jgi:hypothetical protein